MKLASVVDAWKHGHSREPIPDSDGRARTSANFCAVCHNWFYPTPPPQVSLEERCADAR